MAEGALCIGGEYVHPQASASGSRPFRGGVIFHGLSVSGGAVSGGQVPSGPVRAYAPFRLSFPRVSNQSHLSHACPSDRRTPVSPDRLPAAMARIFSSAEAACAGPAWSTSHRFAFLITCSVGFHPGTILSTSSAVLATELMYCDPYVCRPVRQPMPPYFGGVSRLSTWCLPCWSLVSLHTRCVLWRQTL